MTSVPSKGPREEERGSVTRDRGFYRSPSLPQSQRSGLSLIVPAFNEEDAIVGVLETARKVLEKHWMKDYEIIVIDDGSSDNTAKYARSQSGVALIQHSANRGYGAALKTGIRMARFDWVCLVDADGTYPVEKIPELMASRENAAMVVAKRQQHEDAESAARRITKRLLTRFAEWVTRTKIDDLNSGLRVIRRDLAERFLHLLPNGFSFTSTITIALITNHYPIRFVSIEYAKRIGESKFRPAKDTAQFLMLILRTGTYFAPFRVFMPPALLLFVLFLASGVYDVVILDNLTDKTLIMLVLSLNLGMFALLADMIHGRSRS